MNVMVGHGLGFSVSALGKVAGCLEDGTRNSGCKKFGEFLYQLRMEVVKFS